jgi:anti-sigma factor RsiW
MKVTSAELKTLYRLQPARAELNRADCLSEDLLARVGVGDVSDSQRWQITDHLTTCPDCAQEFQIVRATKSWADEMTIAPKPGDAALTDQTPAETLESAAAPESESAPKRWWLFIPHAIQRTGFNAFTAAVAALFFITSLSLGTWLVALQFKHKTELARLTDRDASNAPQRTASDEPVDPEVLQARIEEAQKQLADVQTQLVQTNADRVLSNQELLGIQNQTLQKEMDEIAKPQLDAPIIELDASKLPPAIDPAKETFLPVEIPPTAAMFTAIWRKPADKIYPTYQLEWLDARKPKPLWTGNRKAAPEPMTISLSLVRRNYPSGKYRLRISGVDGKKKDVIDTFNLEVKYILPPKPAKKKR